MENWKSGTFNSLLIDILQQQLAVQNKIKINKNGDQ